MHTSSGRFMITVFCLLTAVSSRLLAEEKNAVVLPEVLRDVVRIKATQGRYPGEFLIKSETGDVITIELRPGKQQQALSRNRHEIEHWEGVTNAPEIWSACEALHNRLREILDRVELVGDSEQDRQQWVADLKLIREGLGRVKPQSGAYGERARQQLAALKSISLEGALERHSMIKESFQYTRLLRRELLQEKFAAVAEVCNQCKKELAEQMQRYENGAPSSAANADKVRRRCDAALDRIEKIATRLAPLPKQNDLIPADPAPLPALLETWREQQELIVSLEPVPWLDPQIGKWIKERQQETKKVNDRLGRQVRLTRPIVEIEEQLESLEQSIWDFRPADQETLERLYQKLEDRLLPVAMVINDDAAKSIAADPAEIVSRYALMQLDRVRKLIETKRLKAVFKLNVDAAEMSLAKVPAGDAGLEWARQLSGELAVRLQGVQRLPKGRYQPAEQKQLNDLCGRLELGSFKCALRGVDAETRDFEMQLDTILFPTDSAGPDGADELVRWSKRLASVRMDFGRAVDKIGKQAPADESENANSLLAAARESHRVASLLLDAQQALSRFPTEVTTRSLWEESDASLKKIEDLMAPLQIDRPDVLIRFFEDRQESAKNARQLLSDAKPRIEFEEYEVRVGLQFSDLVSALAVDSVVRARIEERSAIGELNALGDLYRKSQVLQTEPDWQLRLQRMQLHRLELSGGIEQKIHELRSAAGWSSLPVAPKTLLPPDARSDLLRIEVLLGRGELVEAKSELDRFPKTHPEPGWRSRQADLEADLSYRSAVAAEGAGRSAEARRQYEVLTEMADRPELTVAAASAINRLDSQTLRQNQGGRTLVNLMVLAVLGAFAIIAILCARWHNSPSRTLRRADQWLAKARSAAARGDLRMQDRCLRRVAEIVARLVAAGISVDQLRWSPGVHVMNRPKAPRGLIDPAPNDAASLEYAMKSSIGVAGAPFLLNWLSRQAAVKGSQERRRSVLEWLAVRLRPGPEMLNEELHLRAAYCRELRKVDDGQAWAMLYEICIHWWLGEEPHAISLAKKFGADAVTPHWPAELRMILAICLVRGDRSDDAQKILHDLRTIPEFGRQAEQWLTIADPSSSTPIDGETDTPSVANEIAALLKG